MDDVNCGIYLLSNADAISRKCAVPTIDPRSFRQKLYRLLRLKVDRSGVKNVPSSGPDCQIVSSKAKHPIITSSFPDDLTNQAISRACSRLNRLVSYQISEASSRQPRVAPLYDRDPNDMSHSLEDQPTITPVWNSIIVQRPVAPLSTRLSLTRLADLHQKLLLKTEGQVQSLRETLSLSKKVLQVNSRVTCGRTRQLLSSTSATILDPRVGEQGRSHTSSSFYARSQNSIVSPSSDLPSFQPLRLKCDELCAPPSFLPNPSAADM